LEYEEDEEPNPLIEHRLEASVSIPNIPLPKSSDGQVRVSEETGTRSHLTLFLTTALGYPDAQFC
jgi:hypothetical protein